MPRKLSWIDDVAAVNRAAGLGLQVEEITCRISDIDIEGGRENNARVGRALHEPIVVEYSLAMERGDIFPKPMLFGDVPPYYPMSGNHRLAAADMLGVTEVEAHLIRRADQVHLDLLPRILNRLHGARQGQEEALEHAIYLMGKYGYSANDAAKILGLNPGSLRDEILTREMRDRLTREIGIPKIQVNGLAKVTLKKLNMLKRNEKLLAAAAELAATGRTTAEEFGRIVDATLNERTESAQLAALNSAKRRVMLPGSSSSVNGRATTKSPRSRFLCAIGTIEGVLGSKTTFAQLQINDPNEVEEVRGRVHTLSAQLNRLASENGGSGNENRNGSVRKRPPLVGQGRTR